MADIRIKDLATTATSAETDDYIALDGSTNGSRKMLVSAITDGIETNATGIATNAADITELKTDLSELEGYTVKDLMRGLTHTNATNQSITYAWTGDSCAVSGTASGSSINNIINNGALADYGFTLGGTYYVSYSATSVRFRVYVHINGTLTELFNSFTSGTFTIPTTATDILIRLTVAKNTTASETVTPKIYTAKTNAELLALIQTNATDIDTLETTLSGIVRTDAGITTPYFAAWDAQYDDDGYFSLLDMPQNSIAFVQFSTISTTEVASFPTTDLGAVYIEKFGRGSFNIYKIYGNNRENVVIGFYASSTFNWYAIPTTKKVKIAMMGDSVTAGRIGGESGNTSKGIPYWVGYETGMQVTNLGVGSQGWISTQYLDTNAETYIQTLDLTDYDVLTFMYGANDGDIELGDYLDTTEETIMGAVYRCVNYAMTNNPNLRIIMIEHPIGKASSFPYYNPNGSHSASDGWKFAEYFEQIELFCKKYAIPYIQGWRAFNAWNRNTYIGDNIHPTVAGYKVVGQYIAGQIKALI